MRFFMKNTTVMVVFRDLVRAREYCCLIDKLSIVELADFTAFPMCGRNLALTGWSESAVLNSASVVNLTEGVRFWNVAAALTQDADAMSTLTEDLAFLFRELMATLEQAYISRVLSLKRRQPGPINRPLRHSHGEAVHQSSTNESACGDNRGATGRESLQQADQHHANTKNLARHWDDPFGRKISVPV
jgi:hypothetical protein